MFSLSWFLCFLSIILSFFSVCMMSYIAMAVIMAPWVAPVVAVVIMVFALQFIRAEWFKKYVIISIAAGSVGGMVGMCLGLTWPSLYFLHEDMFLLWMKTPWKFAGRVALLVLSAGSFAFLIAHFVRKHLIVEHKLPFPMSRLVHDIVFADNKKHSFIMLLHGVVVSSSWNIFAWIARNSLRAYATEFQAIPVLLSIGFVAGQSITVPLFIGMVTRVSVLSLINDTYFPTVQHQEFILTFSAGMLLAVLAMGIMFLAKSIYAKESLLKSDFVLLVYRAIQNKFYVISFITSLIACAITLYVWDVSFVQQIYIFLTLFFLCNAVAMILGRVGVIDIQGFISFMILPFTYLFFASSYSVLFVIAFATVCLGLVVDLLFSYKLAHLAKIPHMTMLYYQVIGFVVAASSVGFILWWYIDSLKLGSSYLLAQQALSQELFITFSNYNYNILGLGFIITFMLYFICTDLLVIIGGFVMPVTMSFWFVLAGSVSYLIERRKIYFPFCFGIYAFHSVWMVVRAVLRI